MTDEQFAELLEKLERIAVALEAAAPPPPPPPNPRSGAVRAALKDLVDEAVAEKVAALPEA